MQSSPKSIGGFTLVEVMIVVVIIGLLAAMAIPAIQSVRDRSLVKRVERGESIAPEEQRRYREIKREQKERFGSGAVATINPTGEFLMQKVQIDGQTFYLVPKQDTRETEIAGKTFWLVPVK